MERASIQNYINSFRNALSRHLKENVGIRTIIYPCINGTVLVFEIDFNISNNDEYRSESPNIIEALLRTNLFDSKIASLSVTFSGTTHILTQNKFVLIKDTEEIEWSTQKADADVAYFINSLKK